MCLYASSANAEEMIFRIRHALIENDGNATKAAEALQMHRADLWMFVEDYPDIFADLLQKGTPSVHLLDTMKRKAEAEAIARALKITGGEKAPAARILGVQRTTLCERIKAIDLPESDDRPS